MSDRKGKPREKTYGNDGEDLRRGESENIIQKTGVYSGVHRTTEGVNTRTEKNRYEMQRRNYERKHGKIQDTLKGVKGKEYTSRRYDSKRQAEFVEQGRREYGGQQGVLDPTGTVYSYEGENGSVSPTYVRINEHQGNLEYDREAQEEWMRRREQPLDAATQQRYNDTQHRYNDMWQENNEAAYDSTTDSGRGY